MLLKRIEKELDPLETFNSHESNVRSYIRDFPVLFDKSKGSYLFDTDGCRYLDFFSAAGSLNYGHNNSLIKEEVMQYLASDRVVNSLDMATYAKQNFINKFRDVILKQRKLDYKFQFVTSGTDAVEAALKLAKKAKRRRGIIAFTNSFHGCTSGSLMVTGNSYFKNEVFQSSLDVSFMPFCGYMKGLDTVEYIRNVLNDVGSGIQIPAAIIIETIQCEGGIRVASIDWIKKLYRLCQDFGILLIADEIQIANGRTGNFFSFEEAEIYPDIITLSKSISGYGLALSMLLIKPSLDEWSRGEHSGTFRGNNLAFISAAKALDYWQDDSFSLSIKEKGALIQRRINEIREINQEVLVRGRGMVWGLELPTTAMVRSVLENCFVEKLIVETCGYGKVLKLLPPLTASLDELEEGLSIIKKCIGEALKG